MSVTQPKSSIRARSTALDGLLRREVSESASEILNEAFYYALLNGGEVELGFQRERGASFNPRCARVVAILLSDTQVRDLELIEALMVACSSDPNGWPKRQIADLAQRIKLAAQQSTVFQNEPDSAVKVAALCLILDFLRHTHQICDDALCSDAQLMLQNVKTSIADYDEWAGQHSEQIGTRISQWRARNER